MTTEMRATGLDVVGNMPWGTHFCLFYETKADLLDTLVSYCKAGLENHEFCLWVVAAPVTEEDARQALQRAVPDFDRYVADCSLEIVGAHDWYLQDGTFDLEKVIRGWNETLARASARGYAGVRVTGDTAWLERKHWKDFCEYEESLNGSIANQRLAVLCTYPLAACGAGEILDVVRTHQFAVVKRRGSWDVIETAGHKQAKAEIKRLNEELEQRVIERTSQLTAVNERLTREVLERQRAEVRAQQESERLRQAQTDMAHISRVTTMGELTASLAHEIKQPVSAAATDARTCLRWLERDQPDIAEAREAASRVVHDVTRATDIISSISLMFKKSAVQRELLDVNQLIRDMVVLLHTEANRYSIAIRTELAAELPQVVADAVQLQQVFMNLILNGIDAMKDTSGGNELIIKSESEKGELVVSISDTGAGLPPEQVDEIFRAFVTTKDHGIGMGLPISRSIIESHGGRMWASGNAGRGATFQFSVPVTAVARASQASIQPR
jgi:C4-dicarboxylate-specific signal transduction histidine kinase